MELRSVIHVDNDGGTTSFVYAASNAAYLRFFEPRARVHVTFNLGLARYFG